MNKPSLFLLGVLLACSSSDRVQGNGRLVESERATPSFTSVSVSNALRAEVKLADPRVKLTIDENLLPLVRTDVHGSTLGIDPAPNYDLTPSPAAIATVSSPVIDSFDTSGSARIIGATNGKNVSLTAAGDSVIDASTIAAASISVNASESSRVTTTGDTARIAIDASGAAYVELGSSAPTVDVEASDAAKVTIHATSALRVRASGSSVVTVFGHPSVRDVETTDQSRVVYAD